jgi:hypothetical protein
VSYYFQAGGGAEARRLAKSAERRREKYVRKRVVAEYLEALAVANNEQIDEKVRALAGARLEIILSSMLRDCERVEIDRRLGADALPSGREGRTP